MNTTVSATTNFVLTLKWVLAWMAVKFQAQIRKSCCEQAPMQGIRLATGDGALLARSERGASRPSGMGLVRAATWFSRLRSLIQSK